MSVIHILFLLATFTLNLSSSQRIRWEEESIMTTVKSVSIKDKNHVNFEGESRSLESDTSESRSDLVSKQQYFPHQSPYPPPMPPPFHQQQSYKFPSQPSSQQDNWEWSSTSMQARKPSYVQFPGEAFINPPIVPATSINSLNSNSNNRGTGTSIRIDENCHCGMIPYEKDTKKLQRIVGGIVSKENSWPWMVAITFMGQSKPFWFCGGSLVSSKFVLTAAHCLRTIRNFGLANVKLIMGTNNLMDSKAAVYYSIRAVRPHPLYKSGTEDYDIALLEVKETVNFTSRVSPICLSQDGHPFTNRTVTVAGWGSLQNGQSPPADLREVDLKVVPTEICHKEYLYNYRTSITPAMICAWLPDKDSCQGDSGGPLFLKTTSKPFAYTQIGIVSFGPPNCGTTSIPGVYSRVASATRWIKSIAKSGKFCKGSF